MGKNTNSMVNNLVELKNVDIEEINNIVQIVSKGIENFLTNCIRNKIMAKL